jgi:hypothetical protein
MAHLTWPVKDPDEFLDYTIDWSARLLTDTIVNSEWFVPTDFFGLSPDLELVGSDDTFGTQTTTIWFAGGVSGHKYDILNRITTAAGRIMDQTVKLPCKTK